MHFFLLFAAAVVCLASPARADMVSVINAAQDTIHAEIHFPTRRMIDALVTAVRGVVIRLLVAARYEDRPPVNRISGAEGAMFTKEFIVVDGEVVFAEGKETHSSIEAAALIDTWNYMEGLRIWWDMSQHVPL